MNRRDMLKGTGLGAAAAFLGFTGNANKAWSEETAKANKGLGPLKITKVRAILTAPQPRIRFVVVKVETSEPGLYGLGCATFNQRPLPVKTAVDEYLDPFCRGRDADNIADLWQTAYTSSYWRNGPVLNNALCGLEQAPWDVKAKRAGMPLYRRPGRGRRLRASFPQAGFSGRGIRVAGGIPHGRQALPQCRAENVRAHPKQ